MIRDYYLPNEFEVLYEKKVYLYGAGMAGKRINALLRKIGVQVCGFCDKNIGIQGEFIDDVRVNSFEDIFLTTKSSEILCIVTAYEKRNEIIEEIQLSGNECNSVYTIYGLMVAILFNLKSNHISQSIREEFELKYKIWCYSSKLKVDMNQKSKGLLSVLDDSVWPVILFQPGKVGSHSVRVTLENKNIKVKHSHGFLYPNQYDNNGLLEIERNIIKKRKTKMITIIREPISKDIGHFFQKASEQEQDPAWFVKGIMEKDYQVSFLNYLSVVTPLDFSNGRKEEFGKVMVSHIDYIGSISQDGAYWGWYNEELKNGFGIDILQSDFDKERGFGIIQNNNLHLLILKMEKLNELEEVIADFVECDSLNVEHVNQGNSKAYKYVYEEFKKNLQLPKEYIEFYYKDKLDYMKHFYTEEEINYFCEKWRKHVF